MKKSIVAFAVLGACAANACAQGQAAPQGVVDESVVQEKGCEACGAGANKAGGPAAGSPEWEKAARDAPATFRAEQQQEAPAQAPGAPHVFGRQPLASVAGEYNALTLGRQYSLEYLALAGVGDPAQGGMAGSAAYLIGSGARRPGSGVEYYSSRSRGLSAGASYGGGTMDGSPASRAWGLSIGIEAGPFTLRAAHQNRHVAKVHLYDLAGNNMEAKNSIIAANLKLGWGTAYTAYSVSRGWGSSPLFNPENPYGAGIASTSSTDSRDVLVGVAVPVGGATTLLASFIHRNDRDRANRDANQLAIGASYAVSRRTDFYAAYSRIQYLRGAGNAIGLANAPGSATSAFNVGMRYAF